MEGLSDRANGILLRGHIGLQASDDSGTIVHWDGNAWTPSSLGAPLFLYGVWGRAADDVWAVGIGGTMVHWDGSGWSAVRSPTRSWLKGVWASPAAGVWTLGQLGTILQEVP